MNILGAVRAAHPNLVIDHRQTAHAYGPWYHLAGSYAEPIAGDENPETYGVPISCEARRLSGALVPLAELRGAIHPQADLVATNEIDFVRFEAVRKPAGWEMVKITVLDGAAE